MRLIDLIAQARGPFLVERGSPPTRFRLRGAFDLAPQVIRSPVRYILSDEVARTCAELAFSCGDQLVNCLDLIRIPATSLWIEWSNRAALSGAADFFDQSVVGDADENRRSGLYIEGQPNGQSAMIYGFWSDSNEALACPMDAAIEFGDERAMAQACAQTQDWITVTDPMPAVGRLLDCARFKMDGSWARYYAAAGLGETDKSRIVRDTLGGLARDVPVLIAFLLLLASREGVAFRPICREALNRKRARNGHTPLIDHLEVSLALPQETAARDATHDHEWLRTAPRRHHVRGHLVRRRNRIFWRRPHIRGNAIKGTVLSRTVTLEIRTPTPQVMAMQ
jgi:hypothetical protein